MKPATFDYHAPTTVDEALTLLQGADDADAKLLAGGQSLVPAMNLRMARPAVLIDLNRVAGLEGIRCDDGEWRIGAMTRHSTIEDSPELADQVPVLPAVVAQIGYRPIRNRGTIGGSLCHADPSAEWPLLARLLRMDIDLQSARGSRTVAADEFFEGVFTTRRRARRAVDRRPLPPPDARMEMGFHGVRAQSRRLRPRRRRCPAHRGRRDDHERQRRRHRHRWRTAAGSTPSKRPWPARRSTTKPRPAT